MNIQEISETFNIRFDMLMALTQSLPTPEIAKQWLETGKPAFVNDKLFDAIVAKYGDTQDGKWGANDLAYILFRDERVPINTLFIELIKCCAGVPNPFTLFINLNNKFADEANLFWHGLRFCYAVFYPEFYKHSVFVHFLQKFVIYFKETDRGYEKIIEQYPDLSFLAKKNKRSKKYQIVDWDMSDPRFLRVLEDIKGYAVEQDGQ